MPSKLKYEVTATVGTYMKDGEEKKRYQRCGSVFENEKGQLSIKLDCVPTGNEWSGWFSCYEPKEPGRDRAAGESRAPGRTAAHSSNQPASDYDDESDTIPF